MTSRRCMGFSLALVLASCSADITLRDRDVRGGPGSIAGGPGAGGALNPSGVNGAVPGSGAAGPGGAANNPGPVNIPGATLRRLTLSQYQNSVRDLLGVEADLSKLTPIPPLNGMRAIAASALALPEVDVETFDSLADSLSAQVFSDTTARQKLTGCDATQSACAQGFITTFGRRVFRRPLTDDERTRYTTLLSTATTMTGDAWLGLRVVTSALLESPGFLYREELGVPDPANPSRRLLTDYELASRLSFFVWNTTPDVQLLDAASSGTLETDAGLMTHAMRLLSSPRAAQAIEELFSDYLQLDALDSLAKLPEVFPQSTATLGPAMKQETILTLRTLVFERAADFRTAFTTTTTFANAELAKLYGVPPPKGTAFAEVALPASGPRAGLLMQGSFLATHAHPGRTSPTRRGKFIRENLMCESIPPPPPDVNTTLPDTTTAKTLRAKLEQHRSNPSCAGCHTLMDPIGLALEHFDGIGAYRDNENGVAIDASGELDGTTFTDGRGLATTLAAHPNVASCFARTLLRYARGTLEDPSEETAIAALSGQFGTGGYRVPDLMMKIATDPAFRLVGALQ